VIRVLVVDDHPEFRDGLAGLLGTLDDVGRVDVADSGEQALALAAGALPDVVIMDLTMPGMSGVEATRRLVDAHPGIAVLALTMVDDDETVLAALRAGARGYVLKGATGTEIAGAMRTAAAGGAVFGPGIAVRVLALTTGRQRQAPADGLTDRERDVLALVADGASNAQIARSLGLSLKTVQNYVSRILDKLQVADRTQAALRARDDRGQGPTNHGPTSQGRIGDRPPRAGR
jgi:DNA-binding NarL/FixJ family response regulator